MSEGSRINRDVALVAAKEFIAMIREDIEKYELAGSIRREKATVGDIEIVCEPRLYKTGTLDDLIKDLDSSGSIGDWNNSLHIKMQKLLKEGIIDLNRPRHDNKKNPFGEKYYRINFILKNTAYPVDLFAVLPPAQFAVIFLIRTGSAEYSHWFVQQGYKYGIRVVDGHLEKYGKVINTPEEIDVFNAMHVPYLEPKYREIINGGMDKNGKR